MTMTTGMRNARDAAFGLFMIFLAVFVFPAALGYTMIMHVASMKAHAENVEPAGIECPAPAGLQLGKADE